MVTVAFFEPKALCGSTSGISGEYCGAAWAKSTRKATNKLRRSDPAGMRRWFTRSSEMTQAIGPCGRLKGILPRNGGNVRVVAARGLQAHRNRDIPQAKPFKIGCACDRQRCARHRAS